MGIATRRFRRRAHRGVHTGEGAGRCDRGGAVARVSAARIKADPGRRGSTAEFPARKFTRVDPGLPCRPIVSFRRAGPIHHAVAIGGLGIGGAGGDGVRFARNRLEHRRLSRDCRTWQNRLASSAGRSSSPGYGDRGCFFRARSASGNRVMRAPTSRGVLD